MAGKDRRSSKRQINDMEDIAMDFNSSNTNDDAAFPVLKDEQPNNKSPVYISISSSGHESIKKSRKNDEKLSQSSNPEVSSSKNKDQIMMDKVDKLESNVEEVKQFFHSLTKMIASQSPTTVPIFSPTQQSFLNANLNGEKTPTSFPLFMPPYTPHNESFLTNQADTHFNNADPSCKEQTRIIDLTQNQNNMNRLGVGRKLFTPSKPVKTPGRVLRTKSSPTGYYINYHSSNKVLNPPRLVGVKLPKWLQERFKPSQEIILNEVDVAIATYIFGTTKNDNSNGKEVLVTTDAKLCNGHRETLKTLLPKGRVDQDVLNLLACMLTYEERSWLGRSGVWFLPTTFSQFVLSWTTPPSTIMGYYQKSFMGKVDRLTKIFVPINEDNMHWYLLVIDRINRQLILLDSKPFPPKHDSRKRNAKILAIYIEEMLQHDSFYDFHTTNKPTFSYYDLVEPKGMEQKDGSNDCGVWVATWMKECKYSNAFNIKVDDGIRLKLALELVLNPYNKHKENAIANAFQNLIKYQQKQKRLVET